MVLFIFILTSPLNIDMFTMAGLICTISHNTIKSHNTVKYLKNISQNLCSTHILSKFSSFNLSFGSRF